MLRISGRTPLNYNEISLWSEARQRIQSVGRRAQVAENAEQTAELIVASGVQCHGHRRAIKQLSLSAHLIRQFGTC